MSLAFYLVHGTIGIALATALGAAGTAHAVDDARERADVKALAQRRVYFGHQSVGFNIMDGLKQLAARHGVVLRIEETRPATGVPSGTFGHGLMAENGDPRRKLRSFEQVFASRTASGAELAMLKFCYVDFDANTDATALFAAYRAALACSSGPTYARRGP
jgi:hypothetical protein